MLCSEDLLLPLSFQIHPFLKFQIIKLFREEILEADCLFLNSGFDAF